MARKFVTQLKRNVVSLDACNSLASCGPRNTGGMDYVFFCMILF